MEILGRGITAICLLAGFLGLFGWIRKESLIHNMLLRAQKTLENRTKLLSRLDELLLYSGLHLKMPWLTPENWILLQLAFAGAVCVIMPLMRLAWWWGVLVFAAFVTVQYIGVTVLMARNYNSVDENLLKFLDFLGNYSITSGEITSILYQISNYLDDPLRSVLQECYYEAQTFGDTGKALLSMTRKIQHPKFGEVIRNVEITMRYSADFTILVNQSRRSVREHMRMRQERKSLAREAWVNMLILGAMTLVIFKTVEGLADVSMEEILLQSWIGRGALAGIGFILLLFYRQIRNLDR